MLGFGGSPRADARPFIDRRPGLLGQVLLIGLFVEFYDAARDLAPARITSADANARTVARIESTLHLDPERSMNAWLAHHHTLGLLAGDWYDLAHFLVTVPLLVLLWLRAAPSTYRWLRNSFVLVNLIGFVAYLLVPLTPPRLLPGFVDVVATRHALGGWSTTLSHASDQYASMPSLHVAWALWCVVVTRQLTKDRTLRALAVAYPVVTTAVILATGNHWTLDAVAGAVTFAISMFIANRLRDRQNRWDVYPTEPDGRPRVLILSASVGAGHDGAARELARRLEGTGHAVTVLDYLEALPLRLGYFIRWFYVQQLEHAPASYEWHYRAMRTNRFVMGATRWFAALARHRVLRMVRGARADVVVSTYPLASQALGRLRSLGRLKIPLVTFVTDFSVHPATVSSGVDLSLCITQAAATETNRLCGRPAVATGPMVPDTFFALPDDAARRELRRELGLPEDELLVLVAAGSWGVGNVQATVQRLASAKGISPVVACGRNEKMRAELAAMPSVIALGWRKDMPLLMRACDVVVENAGGLTALEAMASGVPVVSHETIPGHGVHNAEEMRDAGANSWVLDPDALVDTVRSLAGTALGREQAARARELFVADPAVVVSALATSPDLAAALTGAGIALPGRLGMARPDLRLRLRRKAVALTAAAAAVIFVGTEGAAFATEHGLDVTSATGPTDVSLVVRMTTTDLGTPALVAAMHSTSAAAAIDDSVVTSNPGGLASLTAHGIPLASAGQGCRNWTDPQQSFKDLVSTRDAIDRATQQRIKFFVPCRRLSAADLGTAYFAGEKILRPSISAGVTTPMPRPLGGSIVALDGRLMTPGQLVAALNGIKAEAAAQGLSLVGPGTLG